VAAVGVLPALSLLIGATLGLHAGLDAWPYVCATAVAAAGAIGLWWCRAAKALLPALALGFLTAGAALAADARQRALDTPIRELLNREFDGFLIDAVGPGGRHDAVLSRAVLIEDASPRDGFVSLRAEVVALRLGEVWQPADGGVAISVNGTAAAGRVAQWRAGRIIEAPITYRRPTRYLNDGVPDFERDQALAGVTLLGTVKSGLLVDVRQTGGFMSEVGGEVRLHVRRAIGTWIEPHDPVSAAIASAVLIGDRTGLPDETREALQRAGTYHVIAISGGNIAILAGAAMLLFASFGVRGRRAAGAAIVVLVIYALVVTAGPSVWRATLMAVLYFAARTIDQRTGGWQTLSAAAAFMIVISPLDVTDAGFVLTFGATLALLQGARAGIRLTRRLKWLSWLVATLVASLAIEVALLPVSASLFSRVTGAGLVLNLAAVPLMGIVQIAALITALADNLAGIAAPAGWMAHVAAKALVDSANLTALAPWSTARVPPPGALLVVTYYVALAMMCLGRRAVYRVIGTSVWLVATSMVIGVLQWPFAREAEAGRDLRLTMFDVGQGESILVETPGGRRLLIDSGGTPFGGSFDIGARVLAPALWARGVKRLDTLLITHGDPDHLGGALDVLADFRPRELWMGVLVPNHRPTQDIAGEAIRLGIPATFRRRGETTSESEPDLRIRVLHPPPPDWERRRVRNDDSVVLEIVHRDVAVLLTGDISAEVERDILPRLTHATTRVLKVAHHGSRTSSSQELLSQWRPQYVLISAGRGNTFGHPAPEVLTRLEAIGATVLRTDLHGQISVETDGREFRVETYQETRYD
jgi:competence protein ComEC